MQKEVWKSLFLLRASPEEPNCHRWVVPVMRNSSFPLAKRPRVAIIAFTPRSREYGRRALRLLGCSLFIFLDVDEFLQLGERSQEFSMVYLEHFLSLNQDEDGFPSIGERVRQAVGNELPIVHSITAQLGGVLPGFRACDILLPNSLSFAQLCRTLRGFLIKHGISVVERQLEWGAYRFCIDSGLVFVDGSPVTIRQDEFDLVLELFFNAGNQIPRSWLKSMVPGLQALRRRATAPTADIALLRIRDILGLQNKNGWNLTVIPGSACILAESELVA